MRFKQKYKKYYSDIIQGALTALTMYNVILLTVSTILLLTIEAFPLYIVGFFECMTLLFFVAMALHLAFICPLKY